MDDFSFTIEVHPARVTDTVAAPVAQSADRHGWKQGDVAERTKQLAARLQKMQRATYDASRDSDEYKNYWANSDGFDADSAHSPSVRHKLIRRSRYELANNGYADGIAQTYATDLVGGAPSLRMQTASQGFNRLIEFQWDLWCKAIHFRRKLWCMAHAKYGDGEAIAVVRRNPNVKHPLHIDVVLYEAEQCQTPYLPFTEAGYIDGIKFDQFGNPEHYDILHQHPGASNGTLRFDMKPEQVPAEFVLHWFKMRRPGQHRGVPESASTLNLGASFRRLREANLSTAEKVAAWTLFLKTMFPPSEEDAEAPESLENLEIVRGMITTLPNTVEPHQLSAEHPGPAYGEFHEKLLNEQARPISMPRNKAGCDSSSYNYASGRLDHQTYYAALDVEREDCNDLVLDRLFDLWFSAAIRQFGWLGGDPTAIGPGARAHLWDWPKHRVADVESEANANRTRLESGQVFLPQLYSDQGMDFGDAVEDAAKEMGLTSDVLKKRLVDVILPEPKEAPAKPPAIPGVPPANGRLNGHLSAVLNGATHEN